MTTTADHRAAREWPKPSDTLALFIPALGEPLRDADPCWNCGHTVIMLRPDPAMGNVTDTIECGACGEAQADPR